MRADSERIIQQELTSGISFTVYPHESIESMRRLLITGKPKVHESFLGYVVRLTQLNHYAKSSWILHATGRMTDGLFNAPFVSGNHPDLSPLAQLSGVEEKDLLGLLYMPVGSLTGKAKEIAYRVIDSHVPRYFIRACHGKVCALCLQEDGYIRKIWDLIPVTACTIHKCLLLETCPDCGRRISSFRNKISVCSCNYDWRLAKPIPVKATSLRPTYRIQQLCGALHKQGRYTLLQQCSPPVKLNLTNFIKLLFFIARCQRRLADGKVEGHLTTRGVFEIHGLLDEALKVFDDWPEGFYDFLDRHQRLNGEANKRAGIVKDFDGFYHGMNYQLAGPDFDFLRTTFQEYLVVYWDRGYVRPNRYNESMLHKRIYVSKGDARIKLGAEPAWVNSLINAGLLKTVGRKRLNARLILIKAESLDDLLTKFSCVNTSGSSHTLPPSESLDLAGAVGILKRCNIGVGQFVQSVLSGEIVPCSESPNEGINRFRYKKQQVMDYLRFRLKDFRGDFENNLYVPEAAKLMGLSSQGTYFLVKKNLIASQYSTGDKRRHILITKDDIEYFNSAYISSAKLARDLQVGPHYLVELLISQNINPISGPKIDGGIQYVFEQADVINIREIVSAHMPKTKFICRPKTHESILINIRHTARTLGLNKEAVMELIENGVLKRQHYRLKDKLQEEPVFFNRMLVEKLSRENIDLSQLVLLSVAARKMNIEYSAFRRKWIRTGKLPCITLKSIPARRFLWRKDIEALINHRETLAKEKSEYLTPEQAARLLGVHPGTVRKWEKAGKLQRMSEYNANGKMSPLYSASHIMAVRQ